MFEKLVSRAKRFHTLRTDEALQEEAETSSKIAVRIIKKQLFAHFEI